MDATLLIYSGRPNPVWPVEEGLALEVERAIADLPEATEGASPYGGLGYSGVRIDFTDMEGRRRQALFGSGIALVDGRPLLDSGQRLERLILASGRGRVREIDAL
jgi:hypothetical protein